MNIGVVEVKEGIENKKTWWELKIRAPFLPSQSFAIYVNDKKQKENEPDYTIYFNYCRKGEKYRSVKVGGLWKKTTKSEENYLSGNIQSPAFQNGQLYFSLFDTHIFENEKVENISWIKDVVWNAPNNRDKAISNEEASRYF